MNSLKKIHGYKKNWKKHFLEFIYLLRTKWIKYKYWAQDSLTYMSWEDPAL